jgi:hypothetical protein
MMSLALIFSLPLGRIEEEFLILRSGEAASRRMKATVAS